MVASTLSLYNFPQRDDEEDENFFIASTVDIIDLMDRIQVMKRQEENEYYRCENISTENNEENATRTLEINSIEKKKNFVEKKCRAKMCYWFYDVVDSVEISRETVAIAMSYVDQLSSCTTLKNDKKVREIIFSSISNYQLASMTCLYIAIKVNESVVFSITSLARLSRGKYTEDNIEKMESLILMALDWRVNKPTPMAFVRCYVISILLLSRMTKTNDTMNNLLFVKGMISEARYQTELAVAESSFIGCLPSEIALAAVTNCINQNGAFLLSEKEEQKQQALLFNIEEWCCKGDNILSDNKRLRITQLQEKLQLLLAGISPDSPGMTTAVTTAVANKIKKDQQMDNDKNHSSRPAATTTTSTTKKKSSPRYSKESPIRVSTSWKLV